MPQYEVSEGIAKGHPDKVADQISDAVLDACLKEDPSSRVAVETLVSHDLVVIGGEVSTTASLHLDGIVERVLREVGYDSRVFGDLASRFRLISSLQEQSPDIFRSVGAKGAVRQAAGDQGMMYGFACTDTPTYMPTSHEMARTLVKTIEHGRKTGELSFFGPDGKTQVAIDRRNNSASIIVSWQHAPETPIEFLRKTLSELVSAVAQQFNVSLSSVLINPSGRFVLGGPLADTGLTGRKQIVDSYGGSVLHGGGAYSGKDATKVDRTGAYMARYVAKHVVAAGLAKRCTIQLVFSIGICEPILIGIDCEHTEKVPLDLIRAAVMKTFDFSVSGMIKDLTLTTPIFQKTASGGHFGREEFPWEQLPKKDILLSTIM
jgi:S-adenosylmethionine synthetase